MTKRRRRRKKTRVRKTRAVARRHVSYRRDHRGRLRRHIVKGKRTRAAARSVKRAKYERRQAKKLGLSLREYNRQRAARYKAHRKRIDSSSDEEILRTMIRTGQIY